MSANPELSHELLKQNGLESAPLADDVKNEIKKMIEREKGRKRWLRILSIILWGVAAIIHLSYMMSVWTLLLSIPDHAHPTHDIVFLGTVEPFIIVVAAITFVSWRSPVAAETYEQLASIERKLSQLSPGS